MEFERIKNIDPTKSSPLPQSVSLEKTDSKVEDKETGDEYFEKGNDMQLEHFVVLLSKGILRVSDLIEKDGKYYSRKMPLENMPLAREQEMEAEFFILKYLFGDPDHYVSGTHLNHLKNESNQFAHYDYDRAFSNVVPNKNILLRKLGNFFLKKEVEAVFKNKMKQLKDQPSQQNFSSILKEKLSLFKDTLQDASFFNAVLNKSGLSLTGRFSFLKGNSETERANELRKYLLDRVFLLEKISNP
ncbi:MAG: hypothetical protein HY001_04795 [Candidatus Portnoybacteria bacterium]|nr:hypothetical protein [Candidatus Portnoybacteria bacterium]